MDSGLDALSNEQPEKFEIVRGVRVQVEIWNSPCTRPCTRDGRIAQTEGSSLRARNRKRGRYSTRCMWVLGDGGGYLLLVGS